MSVPVLEPESKLLYVFVSVRDAASRKGEVHAYVHANFVLEEPASRISNCLARLLVLTAKCVAVVSELVVLSFGLCCCRSSEVATDPR